MAEDAKRAADETAEQKSGQKQEENETLKNTAEQAAKSVEGDSEVENKSVEDEENKLQNDTADEKVVDEPNKKPGDESGEVGQAEIEAKVTTNTEVETKVEPDEAKEGIPKVTLTVEKASDTADVAPENDANEKSTDDNIEIEIALEQKDTKKSDDFQQSVREQIENCKFEIISSIQDSVHSELRGSIKELKRRDRRHRVGFILRDIVILILAVMLGYAIYCLYDAQYFDFMKPQCEREGNCVVQDTPKQDETAQTPEVVKDTKWYLSNYGYLYDALQLNLNADKVSAYYLYSGDYRLSEIQPNYLLGMAYNVLNSSTTYDSSNGIMIPSADLRTAFMNLFGTAEYFAKEDFTHGCVDFEYDRSSDSFITPAVQCVSNANREIVEAVDEVYEEGNAMYFITTAAIYDKTENAFYNFDNLFKSVAQNVDKTDLAKHQASLNHYQYRFKKVNDNYYFSDIVKLK